MKLSVKKFSKKSLSLLIALIMIFSALPLTPPISAEAATVSKTISNDRHGLITQGGTSRQKNNYSQYQIVNDAQDNNTNAGVLHFDLSEYSDKRIESVTFNAKIDTSTSDTKIPYMNFYYSSTLNGKDSTYLTSGGKETINVKNTFAGYGTGTTANEKYLNHLIGHYDEDNDRLFQIASSDTSSKQVDVTDKIKQIILSGKTDLYIIVMHSNAGGDGGGDGWSDALISPANIKFTVTYSDFDFSDPTQAKEYIPQAKAYIDSRIDGFAMPATQSVICNGTNLNLSNVLYTSNAYLNNDLTYFSLNEKEDDTKMSAKLMTPSSRIVYMYTGNKSVVKVPLIFEAQKNSSVLQRYKINYVCTANNSWTIDNENWIRTTAYNNWDTNTAGTRDGEYYVSSSSSHNVTDFDANNRSEGVDGTTNFRNLVTYNGELSFSNNYLKISQVPSVDMSFDGFCWWQTGTIWKDNHYSYQNNITKKTTGLGKGLSTISLPNTASYSVIDYSGYNALVSGNTMKNKYNEVKENETRYTEASVSAYYKAVANLVKFKTSNYDLSTDSGVESCARELATVVSAYNTAYANLALKKVKVTFKTSDPDDIMAAPVIVKTVEVEPGTTVAASNFPELKTTHYYKDNQHYVYYWYNKSSDTEFTSATKVDSNIEVQEIRKAVNCTYDPNDATCMSKAVCTVCKEPLGDLKPHSYTKAKFVDAVGDNNSYTMYTCTMCGVEDETEKAREYTDQSQYWNTYRDLLTQAKDKIAENEATNGAKYNSDTINALNDAIARVTKVGDEKKSKTYIENENKILQEAITALKLNQYSITFNVVDEYGKSTETVINATTHDYGTMLNLQLPDTYQGNAVSAWKRNINGVDSVVGATSHSLQVLITGDVTYTAFVKMATAASGNQAVITLNNKSNKVYDIGYVEKTSGVNVTVDVDNGSITVGGQTLKAPTYSFYKVKGFKINGKTVNTGTIDITDNIVIMPEYEAIKSFVITGGNGVVEKSTTTSWDKRVRLTAEAPAQSGKINEWTSTINGQTVVWGYGDTLSFQATQACTIECTEVDAIEFDGTEDVKLSVDYVSYNLYRANSITAISRVVAPEGTVEEYGTIFKTANIKSGASNANYETQKAAVNNKDNYKVENKSGVFKASQKITNTDQFAYSFYSSQDYDKMYVGAVAYAKLTDGTYVYSDVVTYEFRR